MNESDIKVVKEGEEAFNLGLNLAQNPHISGTRESSLWNEGWYAAQDEQEIRAKGFYQGIYD